MTTNTSYDLARSQKLLISYLEDGNLGPARKLLITLRCRLGAWPFNRIISGVREAHPKIAAALDAIVNEIY